MRVKHRTSRLPPCCPERAASCHGGASLAAPTLGRPASPSFIAATAGWRRCLGSLWKRELVTRSDRRWQVCLRNCRPFQVHTGMKGHTRVISEPVRGGARASRACVPSVRAGLQPPIALALNQGLRFDRFVRGSGCSGSPVGSPPQMRGCSRGSVQPCPLPPRGALVLPLDPLAPSLRAAHLPGPPLSGALPAPTPSLKLPHLQPSWRGHLCRTPGRPLNWGSIALSLFLLTYSQDSVSCPCCCPRPPPPCPSSRCCQPSSCRSSAQTSGDCPLGGLTALQGPHGAPCQPPTRVSTRPVPPISSVPSNAPSSPRPKQPVSQSTGTLLSLSRLHVP